MNSLILSFLTVMIFLFHCHIRSYIKRGKVKEGFCALWCMDTLFALCGTVSSFILYRYTFYPYLNVRNVLFGAVYLGITVLFILLAPSGLSLFRKKRTSSEEEVLLAEYRFNDTLGIVRNYFLALLFGLPVLFALLTPANHIFHAFSDWQESEICGGFCFIAFLILLPVSLRQSLFWLKNLNRGTSDAEEQVLQKYRTELRYRRKNRII